VDLRFPVQLVSRPNLDFRGFAGRLASGVLRKGDEILALPSGKSSRVKSLESLGSTVEFAFPPQSIMVTLEDEIDISRGDMLVRQHNQPQMERHFEAMLVWMDEAELDLDQQFILKQTTAKVKGRIDQIRYSVDVNTLHRSAAATLQLNEIARVVVTTSRPLLFDSYRENRQTGSFILIDPLTHNTSAVGMIIERVNTEQLPTKIAFKSEHDTSRSLIAPQAREKQLGQKARTYWITGLHASGKHAVGYQLEHLLFEQGRTVVVLDGSTLRFGLNRELGFDKSDRDENLRRVAEMARLLNDQGLIVIAIFLSPDAGTREQVREIIGAARYKEILIATPILECRRRDEKGLYQKADAGQLKNFPGVDSVYEPGTADIIIDDLRGLDIAGLV